MGCWKGIPAFNPLAYPDPWATGLLLCKVVMSGWNGLDAKNLKKSVKVTN